MPGMLRLRSLADLPASTARVRDDVRSVLSAAPPVGVVARGVLQPRRMNRTEAAYAGVLEARKAVGEVLWFDFEAVTLRLGNDTRYTPDFPVLLANGELEMHECKGFMRDDARVKLCAAAKSFPFRFILVRQRLKKDGGGWDYTTI